MARWTANHADVMRLAKISEQMPIGGIALIKLRNGDSVEGVLRRINIGNNGGQGGWLYYGECEIETPDRQRWVLDYLDIESVTNFWDARHAEYERLGLITIVR